MISEEMIKVQEQTTRRFITKVYAWMMLALIITGLSALWVVSSPLLLNLIFGGRYVLVGLLLMEFALVVYLSRKIFEMPSAMAKIWFIIYAVLNGITLSSLLLMYNVATVGFAFLITATLFGIMSLYGYFTKTDLTAIGNLFIMGIIGVFAVTVFNIFYQSTGLSLVLTYIGVFLFIGLIGYDTQRIKSLSYSSEKGIQANGSIMGAMMLYLDFINLFIRLVRLLGRR
ncbi:MAG: Bax inhibitor/YccA family protein [Clostridia bacterium]|jgi:FtsH-binding integral membrane protein|nr:Bax inhibitor/YccA family protein [Clostridia bacterium]